MVATPRSSRLRSKSSINQTDTESSSSPRLTFLFRPVVIADEAVLRALKNPTFIDVRGPGEVEAKPGPVGALNVTWDTSTCTFFDPSLTSPPIRLTPWLSSEAWEEELPRRRSSSKNQDTAKCIMAAASTESGRFLDYNRGCFVPLARRCDGRPRNLRSGRALMLLSRKGDAAKN